jgi:ankyrin repeat protein
VIQALVKAGADVKAGTPNGTTPLMVAAASGEVDAVAR